MKNGKNYLIARSNAFQNSTFTKNLKNSAKGVVRYEKKKRSYL